MSKSETAQVSTIPLKFFLQIRFWCPLKIGVINSHNFRHQTVLPSLSFSFPPCPSTLHPQPLTTTPTTTTAPGPAAHVKEAGVDAAEVLEHGLADGGGPLVQEADDAPLAGQHVLAVWVRLLTRPVRAEGVKETSRQRGAETRTVHTEGTERQTWRNGQLIGGHLSAEWHEWLISQQASAIAF